MEEFRLMHYVSMGGDDLTIFKNRIYLT